MVDARRKTSKRQSKLNIVQVMLDYAILTVCLPPSLPIASM